MSEFNPIKDIRDFHEKFGLLYDGRPRALPKDVAQFRDKFLLEELNEWQLHQGLAYDETTSPPAFRDSANYSYHLEEVLDAFVDLAYVLFGTVHLHGMDGVFAEAWNRVHEANMKKVRASSASESKRGSSLDVVKPEGWEPPRHGDLVEINDLFEPHIDRQ